MIRSYAELLKLKSFEERYRYLKLDGVVGSSTFGFDRYLNQILYRSSRWKRVRNLVIVRDGGCDLGIEGNEIHDRVIVHHMNPIDVRDILNETSWLLNPEYLISTSHPTHLAIHYGDESHIRRDPIERKPGDTKLW